MDNQFTAEKARTVSKEGYDNIQPIIDLIFEAAKKGETSIKIEEMMNFSRRKQLEDRGFKVTESYIQKGLDGLPSDQSKQTAISTISWYA